MRSKEMSAYFEHRLSPGMLRQHLELVHRAAQLDEIGAAGVLDAMVE